MKISLIIGIILVLPAICLSQNQYQLELKQHRDSIDQSLKDKKTTILTEFDLMSFKGLEYFPGNEKFLIPAEFKKSKKFDTFEMVTTTSRRPKYITFGKIFFTLEGQKYTLMVYKSVEVKKPEYDNWLFCPFTDLTNGDETYGGGRFLDLKMSEINNLNIDFNYCYNPYCAYNHKYSCPIPPKENFLNVRIEAGVKKFHE